MASSRPVVRQRRKRLELLLLLSFFLCLLIGIGAFGALWWLRNADTPVLLPSLRQSLQPVQISRPLALHQLSGDPAEALAYQAIAAGELDTAYAIVLYDTALTGGRRAALYQKLAVGLRRRPNGTAGVSQPRYAGDCPSGPHLADQRAHPAADTEH
ncbi:MAG: hypothetical protein H6645_04645 [Caldilineaceae bacterium]|nr:hypothetical protein [Caldilineaceae bacterium]